MERKAVPKGESYLIADLQRISLESARTWLVDAGVGAEGLALVEACARELQKQSVHILGAAERPGGESFQKIYFWSEPEEEKVWDRLRRAGKVLGLTKESWQPLERHWHALMDTTRSIFFSVLFAKGQIYPGAKIYVDTVDPDIVEAVMKETGSSQETCDRARLLLELFGKERFDYFGFRLSPDAPLTMKVYANRMSEPKEEKTASRTSLNS